jgi:hypothetical protein
MQRQTTVFMQIFNEHPSDGSKVIKKDTFIKIIRYVISLLSFTYESLRIAHIEDRKQCEENAGTLSYIKRNFSLQVTLFMYRYIDSLPHIGYK